MFDQFNNKNYKDLQNLIANKKNLFEMNRVKLKHSRTGATLLPEFNPSHASELSPQEIRDFNQRNQQGIQQAEEIDRAQQAESLERLKAAYKAMGLDYDEVQRLRAAEKAQAAEQQQSSNTGTTSSY